MTASGPRRSSSTAVVQWTSGCRSRRSRSQLRRSIVSSASQTAGTCSANPWPDPGWLIRRFDRFVYTEVDQDFEVVGTNAIKDALEVRNGVRRRREGWRYEFFTAAFKIDRFPTRALNFGFHLFFRLVDHRLDDRGADRRESRALDDSIGRLALIDGDRNRAHGRHGQDAGIVGVSSVARKEDGDEEDRDAGNYAARDLGRVAVRASRVGRGRAVLWIGWVRHQGAFDTRP